MELKFIALGALLGFMLAFPLLSALRTVEHKIELAEFTLVNRGPFVLLCTGMLALAGAGAAQALEVMDGKWSIGVAAMFLLGLCMVLCRTKRAGKLGDFFHGAGFLLVASSIFAFSSK